MYTLVYIFRLTKLRIIIIKKAFLIVYPRWNFYNFTIWTLNLPLCLYTHSKNLTNLQVLRNNWVGWVHLSLALNAVVLARQKNKRANSKLQSIRNYRETIIYDKIWNNQVFFQVLTKAKKRISALNHRMTLAALS